MPPTPTSKARRRARRPALLPPAGGCPRTSAPYPPRGCRNRHSPHVPYEGTLDYVSSARTSGAGAGRTSDPKDTRQGSGASRRSLIGVTAHAPAARCLDREAPVAISMVRAHQMVDDGQWRRGNIAPWDAAPPRPRAIAAGPKSLAASSRVAAESAEGPHSIAPPHPLCPQAHAAPAGALAVGRSLRGCARQPARRRRPGHLRTRNRMAATPADPSCVPTTRTAGTPWSATPLGGSRRPSTPRGSQRP